MNCRWLEVILLLAVIVFALAVEWGTAKWLIFVTAIILIVHSFWCPSCTSCTTVKKEDKVVARPKRRR